MAHVAGQCAWWKCGETELQEGAAQAAVSFEDTQINSGSVIRSVRRRLAPGGAVVNVGVLEEQRFNRSSVRRDKDIGENREYRGDRVRAGRFVHGGETNWNWAEWWGKYFTSARIMRDFGKRAQWAEWRT